MLKNTPLVKLDNFSVQNGEWLFNEKYIDNH